MIVCGMYLSRYSKDNVGGGVVCTADSCSVSDKTAGIIIT